MRDGWLRRVVKAVARWGAAVDLRVTRWVQPRPRYRLLGACNGCGRCCEAPGIPVRRFTWHVRSARWVFLWWQRVVNGFELQHADPRLRLFTFRCTHFDPVSRRCDSYSSRPLMCRDYPVNLTYEAVPELFAECSHRVQDKNAAALRAALVASGVSGEKLAEMEEKLFLRGLDD